MNCKIKTEALAVCEVTISYSPKVKPSERPKLSCSTAIYSLFMENGVFTPGTIEHREFFKALLLNHANKLLGIIHLSEGGVDHAPVDVRHLMQAAILANACKLIVCHNHPSGNAAPSPADDKTTLQIKNACSLMGIEMIDHLIITSESYYSYADEGRLL